MTTADGLVINGLPAIDANVTNVFISRMVIFPWKHQMVPKS